MQDTAASFGFDSATGIDLPNEASGFVFTPDEKKALHEKYPEAYPNDTTWYTGDNVQLAIGQNVVVVTPIQLAGAYGALANGGTVYQPHVVAQVLKPGSPTDVPIASADPANVVRVVDPVVRAQVDLPDGTRDPIVDGLTSVTRTGTAGAAFAGFDQSNFPIVGKTGTAQVNGKADTSIFAAFAPGGRPAVRGGRDAGGVRLRRRRRRARSSATSTSTCPGQDAVRGHSRRLAAKRGLMLPRSVSRHDSRRSRRDLTAPLRHLDPVLLVCTLGLAGSRRGRRLQRHPTASVPTSSTPTSFRAVRLRGDRRGASWSCVAVVDYHKLHDWAWLFYGAMHRPAGAGRLAARRRSRRAPRRGSRSARSSSSRPSSPSSSLIVRAGVPARRSCKGDIDLRRLGWPCWRGRCVPMGLIMLQPDLGLVLIFVVITLALLVVGGVPTPLPGRARRGRGGRRGRRAATRRAQGVPDRTG